MAFISSGYRPEIGVKLYMDFGTAYVRAGIQLPNGDLQPLEFNGQNALPAYIRLASQQSKTGQDSEVYVGHNAREYSNTSTANIVFYPTLLLRGDLDERNEIWKTNYPSMIPFEPYYSKTSGYYKVRVAGAAGNTGLGVIELMRKFLKEIRSACEEQIGSEYSITDCVVSAHNINQIAYELMKAFNYTGFQTVGLHQRREAEFAGLIHHFPNLRQQKPYVVIVRIGAAFSTLTIQSVSGHRAGVAESASFGGNDIDGLLLDYCLTKFEQVYSLTGIKYNLDSIHRLRLNCEAVKIQLSTAKLVTLRVSQFYDGRDLAVDLTSDSFRELIGKACYTVLKGFIGVVDGYFSPLEEKERESYELVLLGGTSRIPLIQELITWTMAKPNQQVRSVMDALVIKGMSLKQTEMSVSLVPPGHTTGSQVRHGLAAVLNYTRQPAPGAPTGRSPGNHNPRPQSAYGTGAFTNLSGTTSYANPHRPIVSNQHPTGHSGTATREVSSLTQMESSGSYYNFNRATPYTESPHTTNPLSGNRTGSSERIARASNLVTQGQTLQTPLNAKQTTSGTAEPAAPTEPNHQQNRSNETPGSISASSAQTKDSSRATASKADSCATNAASRQSNVHNEGATSAAAFTTPADEHRRPIDFNTASLTTASTSTLNEPRRHPTAGNNITIAPANQVLRNEGTNVFHAHSITPNELNKPGTSTKQAAKGSSGGKLVLVSNIADTNRTGQVSSKNSTETQSRLVGANSAPTTTSTSVMPLTAQTPQTTSLLNDNPGGTLQQPRASSCATGSTLADIQKTPPNDGLLQGGSSVAFDGNRVQSAAYSQNSMQQVARPAASTVRRTEMPDQEEQQASIQVVDVHSVVPAEGSRQANCRNKTSASSAQEEQAGSSTDCSRANSSKTDSHTATSASRQPTVYNERGMSVAASEQPTGSSEEVVYVPAAPGSVLR